MQIIYIAGTMRSGSTLLSAYLGSHRRVAAIGEVTDLWEALAADAPCVCGVVASECDVWRRVLESPALFNRDLHETARRFRAVVRHRRVWRLLGLRGTSPATWPADVREYVSVLRETMSVFGDASSASTIVDATKTAAGLVLVSLAFPADVTAVHLVRDPRGVAYSEQTPTRAGASAREAPPRRGVLRSALMWNASNLSCLVATHWAAGDHLFVRYEDLLTTPATALPALAGRLGLCASDVHWDGNRVLLAPQHMLVGNPNRLDRSARVLAVDDRWTRALPRREQWLVQGITAPTRLLLSREGS